MICISEFARSQLMALLGPGHWKSSSCSRRRGRRAVGAGAPRLRSRNGRRGLRGRGTDHSSGERHVSQVRYPKGHPKNPLTDREVEDKFRGQAATLMPAEQIDAVIDGCWNLEASKSVTGLMALLELPTAG